MSPGAEFNITLVARTAAGPLSAILPPSGQKPALSLPETVKFTLIIFTQLHGYARK